MNAQEQTRQRQQEALQMARNIQSRGLLERMAQRAVNRQLREQAELAEQRQQRRG